MNDLSEVEQCILSANVARVCSQLRLVIEFRRQFYLHYLVELQLLWFIKYTNKEDSASSMYISQTTISSREKQLDFNAKM